MSLAANRVNNSSLRSAPWNNLLYWLYVTIKREIEISYAFMESNFDAAFVPFPIFATASLLHRKGTYEEVVSSLTNTLLYGFFFYYSTELANNADGGTIEDEINKPNRPIVQSQTTVAAAKLRFYLASAMWLLLSYILDVYIWSLLWIAVLVSHYLLRASRIGPAKDLCIVLGVTSQLMACWKLGGSDMHDGWRWVKLIILWIFFTVPIQDFRDVPGYLAAGRRTTPILLGDFPARIYASMGLVATEYILITHRVFEFGYTLPTALMTSLISLLTLGLIYRLTRLRTIVHDRVSYRWYIALYNLILITAKDEFILLRHTSEGKLERVHVPDATLDPLDMVHVEYPSDLQELEPGGSITYCHSLPRRYREQLEPGETYELVWTGTKIPFWDWGVPSDYVESRLTASPTQPDLILPGGPRVTFTYEQIESPAFIRRQSTPPLLPSDRVQGAPILSVELSGPKIITPEGKHYASLHVRYHGGPTDQPIIFRNHVIWELLRSYRLESGLWELQEGPCGCAGLFLDDPNITVNVVEDEGFITLKPGEYWSRSWIILEDIYGWEVGDIWRYRFKGGTVDWWDYGGVDEHVDTNVQIPPHPWGR
ncbi:UbiA prenyltransferase family protein [Aspergillus luchuensis IFO 4308]|nr:UbiA prenyltransferase family protein [Aspergillus luchuensis IFO 4308]